MVTKTLLMDCNIPPTLENLRKTEVALRDLPDERSCKNLAESLSCAPSVSEIARRLLRFSLEPESSITQEQRTLVAEIYQRGQTIVSKLEEMKQQESAQAVSLVFKEAFAKLKIDIPPNISKENSGEYLKTVASKNSESLEERSRKRLQIFLGSGSFAHVFQMVKTAEERWSLTRFKRDLVEALEEGFTSKENALDLIHENFDQKAVHFALIYGKPLFVDALKNDESMKQGLIKSFQEFEQSMLPEEIRPIVLTSSYTDDELFYFFQLALKKKLPIEGLERWVYQVFQTSKERLAALKEKEHYKQSTRAAVKIPKNEKGVNESIHELNILTKLLKTPYVLSSRYFSDEKFIETPLAYLNPIPPHMPFHRNRKLALHVLRALCFLHDQGVVHGDVAFRNVVETAKGFCLIDFNLAQELPKDKDSASYRRDRRPPVEAPPEFFSLGLISKGSDIYSAALLLLQIAKGSPFWSFNTDQEIQEKFIRGQRPTLTHDSIRQSFHLDKEGGMALIDLIERMWQPKNSRRPSAREAYFTLLAIFKSQDHV